ncbi:MAG TPA: hypothetical protein VIP52_09975 [Candidatus Dormibacteraeota bacterium]|jgi:hypothetical protein
MRTSATASWLQTGVLRLGASLRGVVYGFALMFAVPLAWTGGKGLAAVFIGAVALFGIAMEAVIYSRKDPGRN